MQINIDYANKFASKLLPLIAAHFDDTRFKYLRAHLASPAVGRIVAAPSGEPNTLEWRAFFSLNEARISPWHDIPYRREDGAYSMVVEIPKWTRRKFEIAVAEPMNPIRQDVRHGLLRECK